MDYVDMILLWTMLDVVKCYIQRKNHFRPIEKFIHKLDICVSKISEKITVFL